MEKSKKTSDLELALMAIAENIFRWSGKFFSYALPVIAFLMSIGIGRGVVIVPGWPTKLVFLFLALACFFGGIYLLIKRKSLWKKDDM